MTTIYEGMFVLDNDVVRDGWSDAKAVVTGTLEKHGGKVHSARRWDERRLAYPIKGRRRGTYLLAYYELPGENVRAMRRDFDLSEKVLRYLELTVDEIPEGEAELASAEEAADFSVPEPPPDDAPAEEPKPEAEKASDAEDKKAKTAETAETAEAGSTAEGSTTETASKETSSAGAEGETATETKQETETKKEDG